MTYIFEKNAKNRFLNIYTKLSETQKHLVDQYYEYLLDKDTYIDYPDEQIYALMIDFIANRFVIS